MEKKKVVWVSRHQLTGPQREDLERICGQGNYAEVIHVPQSVHSWEEVAPLTEGAAYVAVVLPIDLMAEFVAKSPVPVIRSVAEREVLPDGSVSFAHKRWEHIKKLDMELETL